ncbi:D-alanyl-D-alanine carboxypeptidase/D-alanyl-D-alanine endopeptidase [Subtercola endophyticus]|uniref:D-alanyl-D-alanine carboxypeptidase/D-alanyl-D-alanine endopeptidase n=1 Tax=Subtercola endophyticus TaxID=2895559 RepID=UPI001E2C1887|nr:D-alanyl-D-alanine carboxypeptidase/D-alanyl-D-alanine-endopeptidase [Subtercola endophyticus]UFS59660.1 D-alanyl-D-alanine carboxypeptidase/D-alanyl-D-alanine-endopeptidase [Subtercola endophyticus]
MRRRNVRLAATVLAGMLVAVAVTSCTRSSSNEEYGSVAGLPHAALAVMNQPQYANGRWLISVRDLDSGKQLINLDGDKMAEPGSFVKTYSTGAVWLKWGPDHTISTPVKRTGEVVDGTLNGNLVLVGKGDLTMGGRTKADGTVDFTNLDHNDANPLPGSTLTREDPLTGLNELAEQVKASGINAVSGQVVVDDRLFDGTLGGQPVTPIIINQNLIDVLVTPGAVGHPASIQMTPAVAPWKVTSSVQTVAAGGTTKISDPKSGQNGEIVVSGTIAADSVPQLKVYAFTDPATFARTAFIEALGRAGVKVTADPLATNSTAALAPENEVDALPSVAQLQSLPLAQEATYVMKISYNRGAQTFVCLLAADAGSKDCDDGMGIAGELWADAGLNTADAALIDGSGLPGNLITPDNAVEVQTIMAKRPDAARWKATLPILGVDGSLATVQADSPAAGKVFAKTGSLLAVDDFNGGRIRLITKTLGGVMDTKSGHHLAFTIMVNQGFYPTVDGVLEANNDVGKVAALIQQAY